MECVLHAACLQSVRGPVYFGKRIVFYTSHPTRKQRAPPRRSDDYGALRPTYIITASGFPYTSVLIIMTYTHFTVSFVGTHQAKATGIINPVWLCASRILYYSRYVIIIAQKYSWGLGIFTCFIIYCTIIGTQ